MSSLGSCIQPHTRLLLIQFIIFLALVGHWEFFVVPFCTTAKAQPPPCVHSDACTMHAHLGDVLGAKQSCWDCCNYQLCQLHIPSSTAAPHLTCTNLASLLPVRREPFVQAGGSLPQCTLSPLHNWRLCSHPSRPRETLFAVTL